MRLPERLRLSSRADRVLQGLLALGLCLTGAFAQAASLTGCSVTADAIAFGEYDPTVDTNTNTAAKITVNCTVVDSGTSMTVQVTVSGGANAIGTQRRMLGAPTGEWMLYNIYTDSAYTNIWPTTYQSGTPGNSYTFSVPKGKVNTVSYQFPVYAKITSGQYSLRPGATFSDALGLTVYF